MAHLLGNRYCIESLRNDVTDLQGTVIDVFSRAGPVRLPSWKYPDKTSCDLDLTELLEIHDYSEDEEERQVAHIVLLELVIDRLVLLLQSMSKYADHILHTGKGGPSPPSTSNTSIGLVVKKYWNKMIQLGTQIQHVQTENKNKVRTIADLENTVSKMQTSENQLLGAGRVKIPLNNADASRLLGGTVSSASNYSISRDENIKATQTIETAFVPCESCDLVQKHFREAGEMVINICTTQDLPSSLARHKSQIKKLDWMCGSDVARWATEQNKDMARINKHLTCLHSTIEPLQNDLEKEQTTNRQLTNRVSECAKEVLLERETQSVQQKQYATKITQIETKSHDEIHKVQRQNATLQKGRDQLQEQVGTIKNELQKQQNIIQELEEAKHQVITDMEAKMTNNEYVHELESDLEITRQKITTIKEQLDSTKKELSREKAKGRSVSKHTEGKQDGLVQRLDALDQDNERLRSQVADLEEEKEELEEHMEKLKEDKREMKRQMEGEKKILRTLTFEKEKLQKTTEQLRSDIHQMELQVQEAQEHERLLVEYPDLNGPVNPDLSGTGDLAVDMQNQVKANSIRITILEEQNTKLRNSITKMLGAHQQNINQIPSQPIPLWKAEESTAQDQYSNDSRPFTAESEQEQSTSGWKNSYLPPKRTTRTTPPKTPLTDRQSSTSSVRESFAVGKGTRSGPSRPPSGKLVKGMTPQSTTSINTYKQLRKAGLLKVNQPRPPSAKTVPPGDHDYQPAETFSCPKCDKMFNSARDLEIHGSYCYGGL